MELNHDLVRSLMLAIEKTDDPTGMDPQSAAKFMQDTNTSRNVLAYHIARLHEAGFINGRVIGLAMNLPFSYQVISLTTDMSIWTPFVRQRFGVDPRQLP